MSATAPGPRPCHSLQTGGQGPGSAPCGASRLGSWAAALPSPVSGVLHVPVGCPRSGRHIWSPASKKGRRHDPASLSLVGLRHGAPLAARLRRGQCKEALVQGCPLQGHCCGRGSVPPRSEPLSSRTVCSAASCHSGNSQALPRSQYRHLTARCSLQPGAASDPRTPPQASGCARGQCVPCQASGCASGAGRVTGGLRGAVSPSACVLGWGWSLPCPSLGCQLTYLGFILAQGGGLVRHNFRRNHLFCLSIQIYWQNLF